MFNIHHKMYEDCLYPVGLNGILSKGKCIKMFRGIVEWNGICGFIVSYLQQFSRINVQSFLCVEKKGRKEKKDKS